MEENDGEKVWGVEGETFLCKYGCYLVYFVFLIGLFLNGGVAIVHFINGRWLFGVWAIFSIYLLPKAVLGLILLLGRKSVVMVLDMPRILWKIFPGVIQKYRSDSAYYFLITLALLKGVVREIILVVISLVPIIVFIF